MAGQYYIRFGPRPVEILAGGILNPYQPEGIERELTLDERAVGVTFLPQKQMFTFLFRFPLICKCLDAAISGVSW